MSLLKLLQSNAVTLFLFRSIFSRVKETGISANVKSVVFMLN